MERDRDQGLYVISVAAELVGVHPQTLRAYEARGLVVPARTAGGSRRYSERDLERVRRINELTAEGVNLTGVELVLELEEERARLEERLARLQEEARAAVERVRRQYRRELVPISRAVVPWHRQGRRADPWGRGADRERSDVTSRR